MDRVRAAAAFPDMDHALAPFFVELARLRSTAALERSPLYRRLEPEIRRVLDSVTLEHLASEPPPPRAAVRATAWNVERGSRLADIVRTLAEHPLLAASEVLLLTELDHGMARSSNAFVAREIAKRLELDYVFAPSYISLVKGAGLESRADGDDNLGIHGNAIFSRHPLLDPLSIPMPNGKDLMRGNEKRLGCQRAVVATVAHPLGSFRAVCVHLDAHSTQRHRQRQMEVVLDRVETLRPRLPVLVGGDWNTSTYDSSHALWSILGYWRRVFMGISNVIRNHYPYPERYFERGLFAAIERRGYDWRSFNQPGGCTWHYDVADTAFKENLREWVPEICFWFMEMALKGHGGQCSLKLDWFAGRDLRVDPASPPRVASDVHERSRPIADHDPIVVDFVPAPGV